MNLPKNGRIVIVDDDRDEALPLIKTLSKLGHPASFFSGEVDEIPEEPPAGIRILFLDMILAGSDQSDPKVALGPLKSVLNRILTPGNGPFLPIAWTKKPEYVEELKKYLAQRDFHYPITTLEKSGCRSSDGEYDLGLIQRKLDEAIRGNESLDFFACWENIVHDSAMKTTNQISELKPFHGDWNDEMKSIILKLAQSYAGQQLGKTDPPKVMLNALFALNGVLTDNLYTEIQKDGNLRRVQLNFNRVSDSAAPRVDGMINSKLNLVCDRQQGADSSPAPGAVYMHHYAQRVSLADLLRNPNDAGMIDLDKDTKHIILEITPACDYAQQKWRVSRLLPGILLPQKHRKKLKGSAQFLYCSPIVKLGNDQLFHLVFDFRFFTSAPFNEIDNSQYRFRIRQELLADIQSHLSWHVSRVGIISLQ